MHGAVLRGRAMLDLAALSDQDFQEADRAIQDLIRDPWLDHTTKSYMPRPPIIFWGYKSASLLNLYQVNDRGIVEIYGVTKR